MHLETPLAFLLLLFLPFVWRYSWRTRTGSASGNQKTIRFSSIIPLEHLPRSRRQKIGELLLPLLATLSFFLLVIALSRPQWGSHFTQIEESGRDIMLVLDLSRSMQAYDFFLEKKRVDRLTALKAVVKEFILKRKGDRFGLVVFGDHAFTLCPLTIDSKVAREFVEASQIGMAGDGTAIGDALAVALKRMKNIQSDSKVIVLVTDGKNNAGRLSPKQVSEIAKKIQIKIHTIGIGGNAPAPFPVRTIFGSTQLVNQQVEYDEKTLKEIASLTGGQYFNAKDTSQLEAVYAQIDKLEERKEKTYEHVEYDEYFKPFLIAGITFFLLYETLISTIFLKIP